MRRRPAGTPSWSHQRAGVGRHGKGDACQPFQSVWWGFGCSSNCRRGSRKSHVATQKGAVSVAMPSGAVSEFMPA